MQPIQDMALKLKNIIKTQKFDEHMDCKIQGEVKHLADAFNQTLAYLRQSVVKRDQLILEIANRVKIEQKLKQYQNQLEKLVNERTLALEKTNQKLITEIEERKVAEHARRELSRKLLLAYEDERKRLARELHDGIGPSLLCIKLELQQLQVIKQVNLQPVIGHIANTVDDLRAMTKGLRPAFCEGLPLTDMLMEYNHYFESISGMSIQCTIQLPCILPDNVEEHLFRIYQEALNNCSKHAKSSEIYISLSHCGQRLLMTIRDNGEGIEEYRLKEVQGLGMFTMKERAALLGGEFSFTSQPTIGSTIRVEIPLPC
ncbi:sensor histidine kinase [Algicola sagamiensis]|uniref:sensor histidine kinase n=1 Tax=Algicola sagamiensis TaxID=163869 RepID=UPI0003A3551B|nr:sensor histidine kinase [Algicola sagamiensis]